LETCRQPYVVAAGAEIRRMPSDSMPPPTLGARTQRQGGNQVIKTSRAPYASGGDKSLMHV